jgi:hypothetical protein
VKTATKKRLLISESHGGLNECTPCRGKPDTHDMYASHTSPCTPRVRFLWAVHVCRNLSQAINGIRRTLLLLRKRAPDTTPSPVEWSPTFVVLPCRIPLSNLPNRWFPLSTSGPYSCPVSSLTQFYQRFQSSSLRDLWPPLGLSTTQPSTISYIYA